MNTFFKTSLITLSVIVLWPLVVFAQDQGDTVKRQATDVQEVSIPIRKSYIDMLKRAGQVNPDTEAPTQEPPAGQECSACPPPISLSPIKRKPQPITPDAWPSPAPTLRTSEFSIETGAQRCGNASANSLYLANPELGVLSLTIQNLIGTRTVNTWGASGSSLAEVSRERMDSMTEEQRNTARGGTVRFSLIYWTNVIDPSETKFIHPVARHVLQNKTSSSPTFAGSTDGTFFRKVLTSGVRATMLEYMHYTFRHTTPGEPWKHIMDRQHHKFGVTVLPPYNLSLGSNKYLSYVNTIAIGAANANFGSVRLRAPYSEHHTDDKDWLRQALIDGGHNESKLDGLTDGGYNKKILFAHYLNVFNREPWSPKPGANNDNLIYTTHVAVQACPQFPATRSNSGSTTDGVFVQDVLPNETPPIVFPQNTQDLANIRAHQVLSDLRYWSLDPHNVLPSKLADDGYEESTLKASKIFNLDTQRLQKYKSLLQSRNHNNQKAVKNPQAGYTADRKFQSLQFLEHQSVLYPLYSLFAKTSEDLAKEGVSAVDAVNKIQSIKDAITPEGLAFINNLEKEIENFNSCYKLKKKFYAIGKALQTHSDYSSKLAFLSNNYHFYTPKWWEHSNLGYTCMFLQSLLKEHADKLLNKTITPLDGDVTGTAKLQACPPAGDIAAGQCEEDNSKRTSRCNAAESVDINVSASLEITSSASDKIGKLSDSSGGGVTSGCNANDGNIKKNNEAILKAFQKLVNTYRDIFLEAVLFDNMQINLGVTEHFSVACSGNAVANRTHDSTEQKQAWGNVLSSAIIDFKAKYGNEDSTTETYNGVLEAKNPESPALAPPPPRTPPRNRGLTYSQGASYITFNNSKNYAYNITYKGDNAARGARIDASGQDEDSKIQFSKPLVFQSGRSVPKPLVIHGGQGIAVRSYPRAICELVNVERVILRQVRPRHYN